MVIILQSDYFRFTVLECTCCRLYIGVHEVKTRHFLEEASKNTAINGK